jgi:hypothetical protein
VTLFRRRALFSAAACAAALALAGCEESRPSEVSDRTTQPSSVPLGTIPGDLEPPPVAEPSTEPGAEPVEPSTEPVGESSLLPEAATFIRLVEAAGQGRHDVLWDLLSAETQERYGPTFAQFEQDVAIELEEGVGALADDYGVLLAVETPGGFAVAAVGARRVEEGEEQLGAFGFALRPVRETFRVELGGPVHITPLVPDGGLVEPSEELAFGVRAPGPIDEGVLWVDGRPIVSRAFGEEPSELVVSGPPPEPLAPGPHVVIGFARSGDEATALAWTVGVR